EVRKATARVGHDERDPMPAQELDELGSGRLRTPHLDRVPDPAFGVRGERAPPFHARIVVPCEGHGRESVAGQELEELLEAAPREGEVRRKLPQNGTELSLETQHPGSEEVGERGRDVSQLLHVGDEATSLDGEFEVVGRLVAKARVHVRALQRIERAVELDGVEARRGVRELAACGQTLRVEHAAERGIAETRYSDANPWHALASLVVVEDTARSIGRTKRAAPAPRFNGQPDPYARRAPARKGRPRVSPPHAPRSPTPHARGAGDGLGPRSEPA